MPTIFRLEGFRFSFYSNEGDPREPPHVHVTKGEADAKFWLVPTVEVAYHRGHPNRTLGELAGIVQNRKASCFEAWNDFFPEG